MTRRQQIYLLPGMLAALIIGILIGRSMNSMLWGVCAGVPALAAVLLGRGRLRWAALLMLVLCVGCTDAWFTWHPALPELTTVELSGVIADEVRVNDEGHVRTILRDVTLDGAPFASGVYWSFYTDALPPDVRPGASVSVQVSLYAPGGAANPGGYDFREAMLQSGVTLGAYGMTDLTVIEDRLSLWGLTARARDAVARGLARVMGSEAGGYAATMLVGSRSLIAQEDREAFSRMGIAHILSVSGFHVGVLSMLLGWLLRRTPLRRRGQLIVRGVILTLYALLTGFRAPIVRAALLSLLPAYARLYNRQTHGLHLLSASAMAILLLDPSQLTGAGFQLTYAAVIGILVIVPWLRERLPRPHWLPEWLYSGLLASFAAQTGLLLPELFWFQELPIFGLLFNLPVMLLSPILLALYWLVLLMIPIPFIGPALGQATGALTQALIAGVRVVGSADWLILWTAQANLVTAIGYVLLLVICSRVVWVDTRRRWLIPMSLLLILVSVIPWPGTMPVYKQLSVGNADAAVLTDRSQVIVVDTGEDQTLSTYLHQRRLGIDALFLTHLHTDHAGGVRSLIADRIPVGKCYLPAGAEAADVTPEMIHLLHELEARGTELIVLRRGDMIDLPDGCITVLWPEGDAVRPGCAANNYSLVLRAEVNGTTLLLTGDLDGAYEHYAAMPTDILKAAHHGSSGSTSVDFLSAVDPTVVLVSCGDTQRESRLADRLDGRALYSTHTGGAITVRLLPDRYMISTFK